MTRPYTGLDKESGANLVCGAPSRRPHVHPADADVNSNTVPGVCRGGESGEPKGDARPEDDSDAVFGETETLLPWGKGVEGPSIARRGPLLEIGRGNLPRKEQRHRRAAWVGRAMSMQSLMMRMNLRPDRK